MQAMQTRQIDYYRGLGQEAMHALRLQEAAEVVLQEARLSAANRAVLVNAVRIARGLHAFGSMGSGGSLLPDS